MFSDAGASAYLYTLPFPSTGVWAVAREETLYRRTLTSARHDDICPLRCEFRSHFLACVATEAGGVCSETSSYRAVQGGHAV